MVMAAKKTKQASFVLLEMRKKKQAYVLIAPFFILFFMFTVLPVISSIVISFTNFNILQPPSFTDRKSVV